MNAIFKVIVFNKFRDVIDLFQNLTIEILIDFDHIESRFHSIIIVVKHFILIIIIEFNQYFLHLRKVI